MPLAGALLAGAVALAFGAPIALGGGRWQVFRPRLALTLWFSALGLGVAMAAAAFAVTVAVAASGPTPRCWPPSARGAACCSWPRSSGSPPGCRSRWSTPTAGRCAG
ncbi:hypothetical protein G7085_09195 [Tessaracoccus sp. HDW20]|nr:hypothetical protein [Tessaracoccus coleopterorum]